MKFKTFNANQMEIVSAISNELENQNPNMPFDSSLFNKIIEATNMIVDECKRERIYSTSGMTPSEWLASDDVGLSSRYMITVLANLGHPMPNGDMPHDAADLGRCIRMVDSCNLKSEIPKLLEMGHGWRNIAENWDYLNSLYNDEKFNDIYLFLKSIKK